MCLNVFIDILIGISPLHPHSNVFAMHIHLHNGSFSNMLYHYTLFLPFPLINFNFHTIYEKITYQSLLFTFIDSIHPTFHVPHSMSSLVTQSIAKPKYFINLFFTFISIGQVLHLLYLKMCMEFLFDTLVIKTI